MKLYDLAMVCRSKNAGPFQVTIDLMFDSAERYQTVLNSPAFTVETIGNLYQTDPEKVAIKPFERILTIKVVLARSCSSGSPLDSDVYGSQQHFPLGNLEIE
ncbi:MAG: DUF4387 domain-containing protein [Lentisphaeria bacterium]|nr:DUF4387 domain-containing protein [Lentisphaeria bacterium]